ncbi:extracellular cellulase CelA/allergen Asp F7-like, putative [Pseudozyma hubeiensis SY62]|uniref:Extracellular cellulase CelA/allergen Asp F7-like, putative n=1 Tax=Pseudozyma hubeiensis (strain SY62) TaxID=1305764 RepID=R9P6B5_PSEHS|nr:extracellular cellulase CelA/allergen Asp F7-like, putative [Pseudozyma hubeiensis SY62]GAC96859.1 extracellular cellulase CelA/allergen Asp F7-like, putative [Pseudozyma hubeiensis SY62]
MHKKKGKCASKHKAQDSNGGALGQASGSVPPVNHDGGGVGSPSVGAPSDQIDADQGSQPKGYSADQQPGAAAGAAAAGIPPVSGSDGSDNPNTSSKPGDVSAGGSSKPAPGSASWGSEGNSNTPQSGSQQGHPSPGSTTQPEGYAPSSSPSSNAQGSGISCKGVRGSTTLPTTSTTNPSWFNPSLIHHGPGTQFGGAGLWQGGACMFDSLPHHNLPFVAMDQSFFQDGLACGTCVEIASTSASLFENREWSVEQPSRGTLPVGKKTVAIVSDLCPGVNQCYSGLDMHLDAWNSVTNNAAGSKLPITWKFVNCKDAFERSNSGISKLQVHWREGASPGFFQVQIRGNHEAVVRVEMKFAGNGWMEAGHVDSSYWKWDLKDATRQFDQSSTMVTFRLTDWQGETIASEVGTKMGRDLFFDANFDRISSE